MLLLLGVVALEGLVLQRSLRDTEAQIDAVMNHHSGETRLLVALIDRDHAGHVTVLGIFVKVERHLSGEDPRAGFVVQPPG
jgi:hypothetical protein